MRRGSTNGESNGGALARFAELVRSPGVRRVLATMWVILAVGTLPGSTLRLVRADVDAPPLPSDVVAERATLTVALVDGSGAPVRGASVRALVMIEERAFSAGKATSDGKGVATLRGVPRGEYWLVADAVAHARASSHFFVSEKERHVDLVLAAERSFDVDVKDDEGRPIAGFEVETQAAEPLPLGARGDASGHARVGRLTEGPWVVTVRSDGYEDVVQRGVKADEHLAVTLKKLATLLVAVETNGMPADDATVQIAGAELWPPRLAGTRTDGMVRIGGLPAGSYAIRASKGEKVSPIEVGIAVQKGEEKRVNLRLVDGHFVRARVVSTDDGDAEPVRGARVTLVEAGLSPFPLEGATEKDGRVRLGPVVDEGATLSVLAEGFVSRTVAALPEPGSSDVVVKLSRAGALTGRVTEARGFPVDGATLEVVGTDVEGAPIADDPRRTRFRSAHFDAMLAGSQPLKPAGELGVMPGKVPPIPHVFAVAPARGIESPVGRVKEDPWVTRSDGTFRAAPVTPGRVRVIVRHPQYVEALSDVVTLAPGGEATVEVVMHVGGVLEGRVVDGNGRAVAGARIAAAALHGNYDRTTRSGTDGSFAFASVPTSLSLSVSAPGSYTDVLTRVVVEVPEGGRKNVSITLPAPRPALEVHVVDDRQYPVDAAQLSVASTEVAMPLRLTAFTNARGETSLSNARGVPLRIEVRAPGHAPKIVATEGNLERLRIVLARAATLTGEVRTARIGDPIPGADVSLQSEVGVFRATTGADGTWTLGDLPPGPARLRVRAKGMAPVTRDVIVAPPITTRPQSAPRVELGEEGVVEGDVVDVRGAPVAGARVALDKVVTWVAGDMKRADIAVTDRRGHFRLGEIPEGTHPLEAYSPDVGRGRNERVHVSAGRTTSGVTLRILPDGEEKARESGAPGGVAVTLGELSGEPREVVLVAVLEGSEAERAGLVPNDVVLEVDGVDVHSIVETRAKLAGPLGDDVVVKLRRGERVFALRVPREAVHR